ncbi:MAG: deoxyribose-phosphate aldolase [Chitinophagia bacterium]|nr:deoxyribose-phosphate aldolase [Chitinophagia bacterium]
MSFNIASYIDHTLLKQTTTLAEVDKICVEASMENYAAVCIPPRYVADAKKLLDGSRVKVATVIGFPLGYNVTDVKLKEINDAIAMGADELDMVHDLCALKSNNWKLLEDEIEACLQPVMEAGKVMKVILETGILTDSEIIRCCEMYSNYKIDYIKTSTGYADIGASVNSVRLIRKHIPARMGIKASGGISTYAFAKELIEAGATRIGCSASNKIMKESRMEQA